MDIHQLYSEEQEPEKKRPASPLKTPEQIERFSAKLIREVYRLELSPSVGKALSGMLNVHRLMQTYGSFGGRLSNVEKELSIESKEGKPLEDRIETLEKAAHVEDPFTEEEYAEFEKRQKRFEEITKQAEELERESLEKSEPINKSEPD